jgi:2-methylisocitrate lyase-like PEP mutase family enzyme
MPGVFDGFSMRLVEKLGFKARIRSAMPPNP